MTFYEFIDEAFGIFNWHWIAGAMELLTILPNNITLHISYVSQSMAFNRNRR